MQTVEVGTLVFGSPLSLAHHPMFTCVWQVGVSDPELAVLRCTVWDRSPRKNGGNRHAFLCYGALPACVLRPGYRNVPMRDANGCKIAFCKMLWHVRSSHTHLPQALSQKSVSCAQKGVVA